MDFEWYDVLMWVHCNKGATLVWGVDSGEAVWAGREAYGTVLSTQICYKPKTAWKNTASVFWGFFLTTACSLQDLSSPTRDWTRVLCNGSMDCQEIPYNVWGFLFSGVHWVLAVACELLILACEILVPAQGSNLDPLHWGHIVLTNEPPGIPPIVYF